LRLRAACSPSASGVEMLRSPADEIPFEWPPQHSVLWLTDERNVAFVREYRAQSLAKFERPRKRSKIKLDEDGKENVHAANFRALYQQISRQASAVRAKGLLTDRESSASLLRILQILPKRVECGSTKKVVRKERRKILAMLKKYVTLDKRKLGAIIVELDRSFTSAEALQERLAELLPPGFEVNLIVGKISRAWGEVMRPHLIFLLPPRYEVWATNPRAVEFYHAIHRRLIRALLPIGADPNQLANPYKFKNPMCKDWDTVVASETFHTLGELHKVLPRDVSEGQLRREAAAHKGLFDHEGSQPFWHIVGRLQRKVLTDARKRRDPSYLAAGDDLNSWLQGMVTDIVTDRLGAPTGREQEIIAMRAEYAAKHWRIDYTDCARGRDAAEIARLAAGAPWSPTASRQVAQRVTVHGGHEAVVHAIARAIIEVVPQGANPYDFRPAVIKKLNGTPSRSAGYDNFEEAVAYAAALSATVHREKEATSTADTNEQDQIKVSLSDLRLVLPNPCQPAIPVPAMPSAGSLPSPADGPPSPGSQSQVASMPRRDHAAGHSSNLNLVSCSQLSEVPDHEHRSEFASSCCASPPSSGGAVQGQSSVDPNRNGQGLQRGISRTAAEERDSGSSTAGRVRPAGGHRTDHDQSGQRKSYAATGSRDPSIRENGEREGAVRRGGHQGEDRGRCKQPAADESLTHASAQLILFVPDNRPAAGECESPPPTWLKKRTARQEESPPRPR
jgi:hypothetical protein